MSWSCSGRQGDVLKRKLNETIFDLKRFAKYYGLWRKHLESQGWATCYFCTQHRHLLAVNIILEPLLLFSETICLS